MKFIFMTKEETIKFKQLKYYKNIMKMAKQSGCDILLNCVLVKPGVRGECCGEKFTVRPKPIQNADLDKVYIWYDDGNEGYFQFNDDENLDSLPIDYNGNYICGYED